MGITTGLPLVVKSHEYKFGKEHPETERGVAKRNEKHIKVLRFGVKLTLSTTNVLLQDLILIECLFRLAQTTVEGLIYFTPN